MFSSNEEGYLRQQQNEESLFYNPLCITVRAPENGSELSLILYLLRHSLVALLFGVGMKAREAHYVIWRRVQGEDSLLVEATVVGILNRMLMNGKQRGIVATSSGISNDLPRLM